jgi:hypothetical protein
LSFLTGQFFAHCTSALFISWLIAMAEPADHAKLPSFKASKDNYDQFKQHIRSGTNPLDDTWEMLVNTTIKKDHMRAWRKPEVRGAPSFSVPLCISRLHEFLQQHLQSTIISISFVIVAMVFSL